MSLLAFFERLLDPTQPTPKEPPASGFFAFAWHYVGQARALIAGLFIAGFLVAALDSAIPVFIGQIVTIVSGNARGATLQAAWPQLLGMALILLVARPAVLFLQSLINNQALAPGLMNMVRWQTHWHVVRQSWTFFQNDFAGRIGNRVIQTGPALRESVVSATSAVWYILVYGGSAMILMSARNPWLALPVFLWFVSYVVLLRVFVPKFRDRSQQQSEMRSLLTGSIIDGYTNILTVKLFAGADGEDEHVRSVIEKHTDAVRQQLRLISLLSLALAILNAAMVAGSGGIAVWLWSNAKIDVGAVAMTLPLAWHIANIAGTVATNVTTIFENIGTVQDGMRSIDVPRQMPDHPNAGKLVVIAGSIRFESVTFGYGTAKGVLHDVTFSIRAGEKIGVVGPSGAGKSTLINLLLHFYELEEGCISIDGIDIASVTQDSLRSNIAVVTQDTALLHRSVRDNIRYGSPHASDADVRRAAERAQALDFIVELEDWHGRLGFDAHVGERGVKLSGGQRQRIAIARVILKNAPIVILDEAMSALDSEAESAIQEHLETLMRGRTVIAIAHRLSTIKRMDRLIVLDGGRIVEAGTHDELLRNSGMYADLWQRQTGSFHDEGDTLVAF